MARVRHDNRASSRHKAAGTAGITAFTRDRKPLHGPDKTGQTKHKIDQNTL